MSIPDELTLALRDWGSDSDTPVQRATLAAAFSTIPYIGGPINEILNYLGQQRAKERLATVLQQMKKRVETLDEDKIDREFLKSAEFQTLLFMTFERLYTTHDLDRLKMFANALVNSGTVEFRDDDKELYLRVLRDLSLSDLKTLNDPKLKGWTPFTSTFVYGQEVTLSLYRLQSMGLVREVSNSLPTSGQSNYPPSTNWNISEFGEKFLRFITDEAKKA